MDNTNTLPRYTNGDGVRAFLSAANSLGATAHNIAISYTNQAGTSGRSCPVVVAGTASAVPGHIVHTGTAANNYGPFLPLAAGDTGMRSIESLQLTAATGTANTFHNLVMCRPLLQLPLPSASVWYERDLLNQFPSLPQIQDGAYLAWIIYCGAALAASSSIFYSMEVGWGNS